MRSDCLERLRQGDDDSRKQGAIKKSFGQSCRYPPEFHSYRDPYTNPFSDIQIHASSCSGARVSDWLGALL